MLFRSTHEHTFAAATAAGTYCPAQSLTIALVDLIVWVGEVDLQAQEGLPGEEGEGGGAYAVRACDDRGQCADR